MAFLLIHAIADSIYLGLRSGAGAGWQLGEPKCRGDEVRNCPGAADVRAGRCAERRSQEGILYNPRQNDGRVFNPLALAYTK